MSPGPALACAWHARGVGHGRAHRVDRPCIGGFFWSLKILKIEVIEGWSGARAKRARKFLGNDLEL